MLRSLRHQRGKDESFSKELRERLETAFQDDAESKGSAPAYSPEVEAALDALREGKVPGAE